MGPRYSPPEPSVKQRGVLSSTRKPRTTDPWGPGRVSHGPAPRRSSLLGSLGLTPPHPAHEAAHALARTILRCVRLGQLHHFRSLGGFCRLGTVPVRRCRLLL